MSMFATIKTFILLFAYFEVFQIGKMTERPKAQWAPCQGWSETLRGGGMGPVPEDLLRCRGGRSPADPDWGKWHDGWHVRRRQ